MELTLPILIQVRVFTLKFKEGVRMIKILKSKTIWWNLLTGVLTVVDALNGEVIPTEVAAAIIAIGNILLRFKTTKPISGK